MSAENNPGGVALLGAAEVWRDEALAALQVDEIRERLEEDRVARLENLAQGAGVMVLGPRLDEKDNKLSQPSTNDLELVPVPYRLGPGSQLQRTRDGIMQDWPVDELYTWLFDGIHLATITLPHFIILNVGTDNAQTALKGGRAGALIHLLMHEDQVRTEGWPDGEAEVVAREAAAHEAQHAVHDHYWEGGLSDAADLRRNRLTRPSDQFVLHHEITRAVNAADRHMGLLRTLDAVIINRRYKYDFTGSDLPPRGMVNAYQTRGIHPDTFK